MKAMNIEELHAHHVAEVNARIAAAGWCYMHNPDVQFAAVAIMRLAIGNEVPLCQPCLDWWLADPETEKGQVIEINRSDENAAPAESLTSSPAGDDGSRLITDVRLYSWGPVMHSPWPIDRAASTDTSTPSSS